MEKTWGSESVWAPQFLSPCQIEGRQRRIEMKIEDRGGTRLTIGEARKLFAIAEEKLDRNRAT